MAKKKKKKTYTALASEQVTVNEIDRLSHALLRVKGLSMDIEDVRIRRRGTTLDLVDAFEEVVEINDEITATCREALAGDEDVFDPEVRAQHQAAITDLLAMLHVADVRYQEAVRSWVGDHRGYKSTLRRYLNDSISDREIPRPPMKFEGLFKRRIRDVDRTLPPPGDHRAFASYDMEVDLPGMPAAASSPNQES